jgi:Transcription factor WhiB
MKPSIDDYDISPQTKTASISSHPITLLFASMLPEWKLDASCNSPDVDPKWFWHEPDADSLFDEIVDRDIEAVNHEKALALCAKCPVQQKCLEWFWNSQFTDRPESFDGIWGNKMMWKENPLSDLALS